MGPFVYAREEATPMTRGHRLQIMLPPQEVRKVDDWRFMRRMPSRAAAIRALLKLGLASIVVDVGRADSSEAQNGGASKE
jgi:hypothetical protein